MSRGEGDDAEGGSIGEGSELAMEASLATRRLHAPDDAGPGQKVSGRVDVEIRDDTKKQERLPV